MAAVSASASSPARLGVVLDLGEKLFVVSLFASMVWRVLASLGHGGNWFNLVQLGSEGLAVALILLRKEARVISFRPTDWLLAIGATAGPLLVRPGHGAGFGPPSLAISLMFIGLICQIYAKLALRFSFGMAPANRGLKIDGPYRLVRHPIYLSYLIGQVGFLLLNPTAWNASVYALTLAMQLFRIEAEERILALDGEHAAFRAAVPYRLIPGLY